MRVQALAVAMAVVLGLVACDADADDPAEEAATPEADPDLPAVATIDPDDVGTGADAPRSGSLDALVAEIAPDLPDGWVAAVVADPLLGPYVVGMPEGTTVWRVGEPLDDLEERTDDTSWARYWLPILRDASDAADGASLRAVLVLEADEDVLSVQISVTGAQDVPLEDARATAETFADAFEDQGLRVQETDVGRAGARDVGRVRFLTPDDEFDDGVPRLVEQWFHPEVDAGLVWSVTCDAARTRADAAADRCTTLLASFRPPPR